MVTTSVIFKNRIDIAVVQIIKSRIDYITDGKTRIDYEKYYYWNDMIINQSSILLKTKRKYHKAKDTPIISYKSFLLEI